MDRLFLDPTVLFAVSWRFNSSLIQLWGLAETELMTSSFAVKEVERNINSDHKNRLFALIGAVEVLNTTITPDEVHAAAPDLSQASSLSIAGAVAAGATHLLTGDVANFGSFYGSSILGILILSPADYLSGRAEPG